MQGSEIVLASLGTVTTVISVLVWLVKSQQTQSNEVIYELSKSQDKMALATNRLAEASERQSKLIQNQEKITEKWQKYVTEQFEKLNVTTGETLKIIKKE